MSEAAIEQFWAFWQEHRGQIEAAIEASSLMDWVDRIGEKVSAIDEDLDWEFGKGARAAHYFCLSAKGDVEKRAVTERWLAAAPAADAVFEYHPARPGGGYDPAQKLCFDEHEFGLGDFQFALEIDEPRRRVHLEVWHPTFATASEDLAVTATFIALDSVLGEDAVERWIGAIEMAATAPEPASTFTELCAALEQAAASEDDFSLLQGTLEEGDPIIIVARLGLKRLDYLSHDRHLEITIPLAEPNDMGLPADEEAERLAVAEDSLLESLGDEAVFIGRETCRGQRRLHLHVASDGVALSRVKGWASDQPWRVEVHHEPDPTWEVLHRW